MRDKLYMSTYMLNRYHERRKEAFERLGGKCAHCGCIPQKFEFDHIDPSTKSFHISQLWGIAKQRYLDELDKCQILCKDCHSLKSITERGYKPAKGNHGTVSSYRYCKCEACKTAKREYMMEYRQRRTSH